LTEPAQRTETIYASKKEKLIDIDAAFDARLRFARSYAVKSLDTDFKSTGYIRLFQQYHFQDHR
jgi:hypothetical protein